MGCLACSAVIGVNMSHRKPLCLIICVLFLLVTLSAAVIAQNAGEERVGERDPADFLPYFSPTTERVYLNLLMGSFDPKYDAVEFDERFADDTPVGTYIVQFSEPKYQEFTQFLESRGGRIHFYLPDWAYIIEADPNTLMDITQLDYVRYLDAFNTIHKMHPIILDNIPEGELSGNMDIMLPINFYPFDHEIDLEKVQSELETTGQWTLLGTDSGGLETLSSPKAISEIIKNPDIAWAEWTVPFVLWNNNSAYATELHEVWDTMGLTGSGQKVTVADTGIDTGVLSTMHDDMKGRVKIIKTTGTSAIDTHGHGTHCAGTVMGNGAKSSPVGRLKGVAYEAFMCFQDIGNDNMQLTGIGDFYWLLKGAYDEGVRTHSNSWGTPYPTGHAYLSTSQRADYMTWTYRNFTVFVANGNDGGYGLDTVSAPATAKNVMGIGAGGPGSTGGLTKNHIASFSSRGHCPDGRIKPDLVTPGNHYITSCKSSQTSGSGFYTGMGGTSMACPHAAGVGVLVRQYWQEWREVDDPSSSLIRATLINGAKDMTSVTGSVPNKLEGWGRCVLPEAINPDSPSKLEYFDNKVGFGDGGGETYSVGIGDNSIPFNVTLVWVDYPSSTSASKNIVNDLDLKVTAPDGTTIYKGNVLTNSYSTTGGSFDRTNVVETVRIQTPQIGVYEINVTGYNVPQPTPTFAIAMTGGISSSYGKVSFDRVCYRPNDNASIRVIDADLEGDGALNVNVSSDSAPVPFAFQLTETPPLSGVFEGLLPLTNGTTGPGELYVQLDDNITVQFYDANPLSEFRYDTATIKIPPPIYWIKHNAPKECAPRDRITINLNGSKNCAATFSLEMQPHAQNLSMFDDGNNSDGPEGDGTYGTIYEIQWEDMGTHNITGYLTNGFTAPSSLMAVPPIWVNYSAPSRPTEINVTALPQGNALNISWKENPEPNIVFYRVYRSDQSYAETDQKNYTLVGSSTGLFYHDEGLEDGKKYYYSIRALMAPNNLSYWSREAWGIPEDTLGPWSEITFPIINSTIGQNSTIAYQGDTDLLGVEEIQYYVDTNGNGTDDDGNSWINVTVHGNESTGFYWYTDPANGGPGEGASILLRMRGFDEMHNVGNWSPYIKNITIDNTIPSPPILDDNLPTITNVVDHTLTGSTEFNGSVKAFVGLTEIGEQDVDVNGTVNMDISLPNVGYNNITLTAFDRFGNGPSPPSVARTVIFDDILPVSVPEPGRTLKPDEAVTLNGTGSYDICPVPAYAGISDYEWEFEDAGNTIIRSGESLDYTFIDAGVHVVTLRVTDMAGNVGENTTTYFMGDTVKPIVEAGPDIYADEDTLVSFNATLCSDNDPSFFNTAEFNWTFKEGVTNITLFGIQQSYIFTEPGDYEMTLKVTDYSGNWALDIVIAHIKDVTPPNANAGKDLSLIKGRQAAFDGTGSTDNSRDFDETGIYEWSFEDGIEQVELNGTNPVYTFTKAGQYIVTLKVTDSGDNFDTDDVTVNVIDDVSLPAVVSTSPANGAEDIQVGTNIEVVFSESVQPDSLSTKTMALESNDGKIIPGSIAYDDSTKKMTFDPSSDLEIKMYYTFTITTGVKDIAGNGMKQNFAFSFQTTTPPYVTSFYPLDNSINVSRRARINATFSEAMDKSLFKDDDVELFVLLGEIKEEEEEPTGNGTNGSRYQEGFEPFNGSLKYIEETNNLSFNPEGILDYNTTYIVILTIELADKNGVAMENEFTWTFTTEIKPVKIEVPDNETPDDDDDIEPPPVADDDDTVLGMKFMYWIILIAILAVLIIAIIVVIGLVRRKKQEQEAQERKEQRQREYDEEMERRREERERRLEERKRRASKQAAKSAMPRGLTPAMMRELVKNQGGKKPKPASTKPAPASTKPPAKKGVAWDDTDDMDLTPDESPDFEDVFDDEDDWDNPMDDEPDADWDLEDEEPEDDELDWDDTPEDEGPDDDFDWDNDDEGEDIDFDDDNDELDWD